MKKILFSLTTLFFFIVFVNAQNTSPYWSLAGNSNATSSSKLGTTNGINLRFYTNNSERARITTSGLVGIGTTSPTDKLHVNSPSGTNAFRAQVNGSTKLIVHSNGSVGIGTTSPDPNSKLDVRGGNTGIYTTGSNYGSYSVSSNTGAFGSGEVYGVYGYNPFSTGTGVHGQGGTYGVSGETYGLHGVHGHSWGDNGAGVYGEASGNGGSGVYGSGHYGVFASSTYSSGDGVRSRVSGSSNFAVNAYSSNSYGVYGATGNSSSYAGYFTGSVYSTGTYQGSDAKLKKNIKEVDNGMNIINRLQPKNYEYRNDGNFAKMNLPVGKHYGFLAQDLEKVLPNLVKETQFNTAKLEANLKEESASTGKELKGESIDFKAVNYIELIPIVVKGMQEQQTLIEELKAENLQKDKLISDLQSQINDIKSLISTNRNGTISQNGYLKQNYPNPANNNTTINYYTPVSSRNAEIVLTDMKGRVIKTYTATKGEGQINISSGELSTGIYNYTLYVNRVKLDTKQMNITK